MCGVAEYFFPPAVYLVVLVGVLYMRYYSRFRARLDQFISERELSRRGELDSETGGLVVRYFVLRTYRECNDAELNALGERVRKYLIVNLVVVLAFIIFTAATVFGSVGSVASCYGL